MPAIGARTTAGSTASGPSFNGGRAVVVGSSVLVTTPRVGGVPSATVCALTAPAVRHKPSGRPSPQQPALLLGGADGLGAVARAGLADRRGEVVAHRALR